MQFLGTDQVAAEKNDRLPASVLIAAQSVLDQRDGSIADPTFAQINGRRRWVAGVIPVAFDDPPGMRFRVVTGFPGDVGGRSRADRRRRPILAGAARRGHRPESDRREPTGRPTGDSAQLPTVTGLPENFRVAGVFRPTMIDDAAVGTSSWRPTRAGAHRLGVAVRDQVSVAYSPLPEAASTVTISLSGAN